MRYLLILCLSVLVFAKSSYDFDEYKFVSATSKTAKQSGNIIFEKDKTIITYFEPKYKQIISSENNVTITGKSGKTYVLKGKGRFYTKLFIDVMAQLGDLKSLKSSKDFLLTKTKKGYSVAFRGDIKDAASKAEVNVEDLYVKGFKLFMKNGDTIEIIKK